jgi:Na+/citrate or Na+/malate symporter
VIQVIGVVLAVGIGLAIGAIFGKRRTPYLVLCVAGAVVGGLIAGPLFGTYSGFLGGSDTGVLSVPLLNWAVFGVVGALVGAAIAWISSRPCNRGNEA